MIYVILFIIIGKGNFVTLQMEYSCVFNNVYAC